jgi:hypothetical protein
MRSYLYIVGGLLAGIVATVMTVNACVDPYDISAVRLPGGKNAIKPQFSDRHVLGKPFIAWRRQPMAVVFGTSRENHAIDPEHPAWPTPPGTRYNLAMDAANIADIERLFTHITSVAPVKEAVIALDFLNMFDAGMHGAVDLDPSLLVKEGHPRSLARLNSLRYFASAGMLKASADTLRNQDPALIEFEPTGRRNSRVFAGAAERFGQHHMFEFSEARYFRARLNLPPAQRYTWVKADGSSTLKSLAAVLDRAAALGIEVHLFVTPVHARQLEVYRMLGLWPAMEDWKRAVTRIAAGGMRNTGTRFPLWDFADYSPLTCEPVPRPGDLTTRMQWYWESSHFTRALGDRVLMRIFGAPSATQNLDPFGTLLDSATLNGHLESIRARGELYRATHAQDLADLAREAEQVCASGIVESM